MENRTSDFKGHWVKGGNMDDAMVLNSELDKIRRTDNGLKDCDLEQPNQNPEPLTLDENGVPVDFKVGE